MSELQKGLRYVAADMRRKYLEAIRDESLGYQAGLLSGWLSQVEPAADALDAQAAEIAALRARLAEAERAIAAHNDSCASACGIGDQEGVRCGYRDYFPRHCPECPRGWMIDAARGGA